MPTRTIYVKDEELWDKAKKLAGPDRLSAVICEALADFVSRKEAEAQGLPEQSIEVDEGPHGVILKFYGRRVGEALLGRGQEEGDGLVEVFETKAGTIVVVLGDASSGRAYEHHTYKSFEELCNASFVPQIPDSETFLDNLANELGVKSVVWID